MTKTKEIFLKILKNSFHPEMASPAELESALMGEGTDWESVLNVAKKQNLFPFVYDTVTGYPAFSDFDAANPDNFMFTTLDVSAQMQRTEAFLHLYQAFLSHNLMPIVMKGIICRSLYGEKADFRPSGDEDILIEKRDYVKAVEILEACGYQKEADPDAKMTIIQEVTFHSENLTVELHLNPFGLQSAMREKMNDWFRNVFRSEETVEIKGVQIRTMTPTDHFLFLVFHAFKHFIGGGFGVRMMLDILLFVEKYEKRIDWAYVSRGMNDIGATGFYADLVELGNRYLAFSLSQKYIPVCPAELLDDMFQMGIFGNSTGTDRTAGRMVADTVQKGRKHYNNKIMTYIRLLFPSRKTWYSWQPYLKDKPWMILPEWFRRIGRFMRGESSTRDMSGLDKSYHIAEKRIDLLKKYGVL